MEQEEKMNDGRREARNFEKRPARRFEKVEYRGGERREGFAPRAPREGGFERRAPREGGFERREGFAPRAPREGGFERRAPREGGFERREGFAPRAPREGGFERRAPREGGFERREGFAPRAPREGGFERRAPREGGFERREGFAPRAPREGGEHRSYDNRFNGSRGDSRFGGRPQRPFGERVRKAYDDNDDRRSVYSKKKQLEHKVANPFAESDEIRLNRYISISGICSRRDADKLITDGRVKVNGQVQTVLGVKVKKTDLVEVDDKVAVPERKIYLVLNKPKDYVTTVEDPQERKTVMSLIEGACPERVYPVGRLDRMTTGVLLFTNDGDLAKKLTHPSYEHKKIYHAFLDKPLTASDMSAISDGIELEDGVIAADEISYASDDQTEVGIEIHSGRNRVVRRIFEHLGYEIQKLDRVYFAGITKKDLPRGQWRMLTPAEVNYIKNFN